MIRSISIVLWAAAVAAAPVPSSSALVDLAMTDMQHSRETADPAWYRRAAAALDAAAAAPEADAYVIMRARAWVRLGEHDFHGARVLAEQARDTQPRDWWNHATVADACVELGDYACAEHAVDALLALRPGIQAYTRAAWLRTLYGDRPGAIELLELAVHTAKGADAETQAWTLVHLAAEELAEGQVTRAASHYEAAVAALPTYHLALAGLGRARIAQGRLDDADALLVRATARVPAPDLVAALGDVRAARGDAAGAAEQYGFVEYLAKVATANGGTYGRQLALFYADHDQRPAEAVRLAREETAIRDDVFTADALAWALLKADRPRAAARAMHRARRLGTDDANFAYHAGMIAARLGRDRIAARLLRNALAGVLAFDLHQAPVARAELARLERQHGEPS